jgi:protein TonB
MQPGDPRGSEAGEKVDKSGDQEIFYIVEDLPKFQGKSHHACRAWIQDHLEYPREARAQKIRGKVYVQFIVNAKGKVIQPEVKKGVDPSLDRAALKAVQSMPDWTPGFQRGKPVAVMFLIPVQFAL